MIPCRPHDLREKAKGMDIPYPQAVAFRIKDLLEQMTLWGKYMDGEIDEIPYSDFWGCLDEIIALKNSLKKVQGQIKDRITDEMKERAKAYPINNLIEFQNGVALCFNHNEKTPSLHYYAKNNRAHCFGGCDLSFDSIDVLIIRDGFTFEEAVKELNRR